MAFFKGDIFHFVCINFHQSTVIPQQKYSTTPILKKKKGTQCKTKIKNAVICKTLNTFNTVFNLIHVGKD